ncbi:MFS transporter [Methanogenium organophilum]|uniref:MFS transporter n=1 Tax=Methanogenium organophilum TaxID=2199 RepID=A0A9X9T9A5_METOG|nr:MFS transporter [Methanogenium organophilum]WAI01917.1 MFS transporter [Methanogenium organophilum]
MGPFSPLPAGTRRNAYAVILLFGIVSLFGDMCYEGARSVAGPYLYILGGSAFVVAFVAGFGEFVGYGLRLISGYVADATRHYWTLTFLGYGMLLAVPFLALAGSWEIAAVLYIIERMGKGIRAPAKDAILSNVTVTVGRGWGFAIHEAMDQIGAIAGPLIFSAVFLVQGDYRGGFALLLIPFFLMMAALYITRMKAPVPEEMEMVSGTSGKHLSAQALVPYGIFTALTMAGFAVFPLIAYHYSSTGIVSNAQIPLFYAIAMGVDAVVALVAGRLYDRHGLIVLAAAPVVSFVIPFFAFGASYGSALFAAILWGAVMGIQETILRAAVADYTAVSKRGLAYGIFNTIYGASWFAGSLLLGWVYEISVPLVIAIMALVQCIALPVFFYARRVMEAGSERTLL